MQPQSADMLSLGLPLFLSAAQSHSASPTSSSDLQGATIAWPYASSESPEEKTMVKEHPRVRERRP